MKISHAISHLGAWETITASTDIIDLVNDGLVVSMPTQGKRARSTDRLLERSMLIRKSINHFYVYARAHGFKGFSHDESNDKTLGVHRDKISLQVMSKFSRLDAINWIYADANTKVNLDGIAIPIVIIFDYDLINILKDYDPEKVCEKIMHSVSATKLIAVNFPFLVCILDFDNGEATEVIELTSNNSKQKDNLKVLEKCIEFAPEHYQAGVNILSYFGTYLKKNYPSTDAKIKIEQEDATVRLVIESSDGSRDIIEKALDEYGMIVNGDESPESIVSDRIALAEVKMQLRLAQTQIETQKELLQIQAHSSKELFSILKESLSSKHTINVSLSSTASNVASITTVNNVAPIIGGVSELIEELKKHNLSTETLADIVNALRSLEPNDKESVSQSSGLNKLKRFIDSALKNGTEVNEKLNKVGDGLELVKDLGKKYNNIAQWCALPTIPDSLLE